MNVCHYNQDTIVTDGVLNFQDKMEVDSAEMEEVIYGTEMEWNRDDRAIRVSVLVPDGLDRDQDLGLELGRRVRCDASAGEVIGRKGLILRCKTHSPTLITTHTLTLTHSHREAVGGREREREREKMVTQRETEGEGKESEKMMKTAKYERKYCTIIMNLYTLW